MTAARPDTWMPTYWGDYARDTAHLDNGGHGAYLMLIKHYWCTGSPLPDDDAVLWRIACCNSPTAWKKLRTTILAFFDRGADGKWHHKRIDHELQRATDITDKRRAAGLARAQQAARKQSAHAEQEQQQTGEQTARPSQPQPPRDAAVAGAGARDHRWGEVYYSLESILSWPIPMDGSRIHAWLEAGFDPELDIYPTIRRLSANGKQINTLKYFDAAIADAMARRLKPVPQGNPNDAGPIPPFLQRKPKRGGTEEIRAGLASAYRKRHGDSGISAQTDRSEGVDGEAGADG